MSFRNNFYYDSITEKYSTDKGICLIFKISDKVENLFFYVLKSVGKFTFTNFWYKNIKW